MKCPECGAEMVSRRENHKYVASGLSNVVLCGIEVRKCGCGEEEIVIPRIEELHETIARHLITRRTRLQSTEIRFLRKHLGWSGADFANHIGVTPESVSRWENGQEMSALAERVLRLMVAVLKPAPSYPIDVLANLADARGALRVALRQEKDHWQVDAPETTPGAPPVSS